MSAPSSCWYVYILRCADGSLYTGVTTDTDRRIKEHNLSDRLGARYTRARRPVSLAYREPCENRSVACKREAQIKALPRSAKLKLLQSAVGQ
ncbi:GIY-YIG nuclease family protein [Amphritea pacifica]|uniref:GIY-YIG nuclease family protein n=1 Tax=Amphritea pacifica TaxID=2811233 RepID=A0ABS2WAI9_9GAMM|nr:GIY-YIG nuclease family protein [Amphritea pacifica]MBN0988620.1 GIY-YIG nuclease family protein [Amphritea pacifica]MBN1007319.1 GIY-YIG nuclease family protein [Amphritea pacifica]